MIKHGFANNQECLINGRAITLINRRQQSSYRVCSDLNKRFFTFNLSILLVQRRTLVSKSLHSLSKVGTQLTTI